ncbi:MAG: cation transporter [Christensenellales bacterium]
MKRQARFTDLGCAVCAAEMEEAIKKIDGVNNATINYMTQKLTIEAEESMFEDIMKKVSSVCRRIEPGCKLMFE